MTADDTALKAAQAANDNTKISAAQAAKKTDQTALDQATTALAVAKANQGKWQESATLTVLAIAPDATARFTANLSHNWTRDDTLKISVINGLLTTSSSTSVGQTPNLIISLADTAITIATLGTGGFPGPAPAPAPGAHPAPVSCYYSIAQVFDPLNEKEVSDLNGLLRDNAHSNIKLSIPELSQKLDPLEKPSTEPPKISGLVYRVATVVDMQLVTNSSAMDPGSPCPLASYPAAQSITTVVPDSRTQFVFSSTAGSFTTTNLTFGFSNGMLTDYTAQRPSELMAIAGIPVRIATDIMQIPTSIFQARVNLDTQKTALVNGDTALKQAQIQQAASLNTAQTAVVNAQAALATATVGKSTSIVNAQTALVQAQTALKQAINAASAVTGQ
ncbi:hypothetical protein AB4Y43_16915 [Paraburkholderia sp. BR10872]|uniref:hypothetical protein n=1 Tax=Paraburkholderia sp. BR10872 TaxID=3236989 RepID=UPI0034D2E0D9